MENGYLEMWDNWPEKGQTFLFIDNWLDEYFDGVIKNKYAERLDLSCGT